MLKRIFVEIKLWWTKWTSLGNSVSRSPRDVMLNKRKKEKKKLKRETQADPNSWTWTLTVCLTARSLLIWAKLLSAQLAENKWIKPKTPSWSLVVSVSKTNTQFLKPIKIKLSSGLWVTQQCPTFSSTVSSWRAISQWLWKPTIALFLAYRLASFSETKIKKEKQKYKTRLKIP